MDTSGIYYFSSPSPLQSKKWNTLGREFSILLQNHLSDVDLKQSFFKKNQSPIFSLSSVGESKFIEPGSAHCILGRTVTN